MTAHSDDRAYILRKQKIEDFLNHEEELLDARRYEDWPGLLLDDVRYCRWTIAPSISIR